MKLLDLSFVVCDGAPIVLAVYFGDFDDPRQLEDFEDHSDQRSGIL